MRITYHLIVFLILSSSLNVLGQEEEDDKTYLGVGIGHTYEFDSWKNYFSRDVDNSILDYRRGYNVSVNVTHFITERLWMVGGIKYGFFNKYSKTEEYFGQSMNLINKHRMVDVFVNPKFYLAAIKNIGFMVEGELSYRVFTQRKFTESDELLIRSSYPKFGYGIGINIYWFAHGLSPLPIGFMYKKYNDLKFLEVHMAFPLIKIKSV